MTLPRLRGEVDEWALNRVYGEVPGLYELENYSKRLTLEETREFDHLLGNALYPAITAAFALGVHAALNPALLAYSQEDDHRPVNLPPAL